MKMSVHLNFNGNCAEAFGFYTKVFQAKNPFSVTYAEAPEGNMPIPPEWKSKVMHASIELGEGRIMGCDAPPGSSKPMGGFQVCVESEDEAEVRRVYDALAASGSVQMPLMKTFWSPLFGMCTDKFGVAWMVGMPGASQ
jgi:PhnB protein